MANIFNGIWTVSGAGGTNYAGFFQVGGSVAGGGALLTVDNGDGSTVEYEGTGLTQSSGILTSGTITRVTVRKLGDVVAHLDSIAGHAFHIDTAGFDLLGGSATYNLLLSGDNLIVGSTNGTAVDPELLDGGTGNDTFKPGNAHAVLNDITGVTTLDLSGMSGPSTVDLNLQTFTVGGATGSMNGVSHVVGTTAADTIVGTTPDVFVLSTGAGNDVIDAYDTSMTTPYGARVTLDAGSGDDTVTINQFGYGILDGGDGNDTLRAGGDIRFYTFNGFETIANTNFLRVRTEQLRNVDHITDLNPFNGDQVGVELRTNGTVDFHRLMAPGLTVNATAFVAGTHITGTAGDDTLSDFSNGLIDGLPAYGSLTGGGGNDTINNNSGTSLATYSGNMADYTIVHYGGLGSTFYITDNRPGSPDGTDTLVNVSVTAPILRFRDYTASIDEQQAYKADQSVLPKQIYNGILVLSGPDNFDYAGMFPALDRAVSATLAPDGSSYTITYANGIRIDFAGTGLATSSAFVPSGGSFDGITVSDTSIAGSPVVLAHLYSSPADGHIMKVPFTSDILTGGERVYQLLMSGNNRIVGSDHDDIIVADIGQNTLDGRGGFNTLYLGREVDSFDVTYTPEGQISTVHFVDEEANYFNFNIFDPDHPIIVNLNKVTTWISETFPPAPSPPASPPSGQPAKGGGDPHITTLDGVGFSFHAVGEFVLTRSTVPGDAFEIQMRTIPFVGLASVIEEAGTAVGSDRVIFDASRANVVMVNGADVDLSSGPIDLDGGTLALVRPGNWSISYDSGETLTVAVIHASVDFLNLSLDAGALRAAGTLEGIWGNYDGDRSNDFALDDGTVLSRPLSKATLYSIFANEWRVHDGHSLLHYEPGETTATFTDTATPTTFSLTDLPDDVVTKAEALVNAAGIGDQAMREFAIYDYILTGDAATIDAIAALGEQAGSSFELERPTSAPAESMLGVIAASASVVEAEAGGPTLVSFEVFRTGPALGNVRVDWSVIDPGAGYFDAADFPGNALPSGQVTILNEQTSAIFTVQVPDGAVQAASELLRVAISNANAIPLLAPEAQAEIISNAPATGATALPEFIKLAGGGTLTHVGDAWTLDLGTLPENTSLADIKLAVVNAAGADGNDLSGTFSQAGAFATIAGAVTFLKLAAGGVKGGLTLTDIVSDKPGSFQSTLTLAASESNDTGYKADIPDITLTVKAILTDVPDTIIGTSAGETLVGENGIDFVYGLGGNDRLFGLGLNDILVGGTGRDIMSGGSGFDDFDFNSVRETGKTSATRDRIVDFVHNQDDLDLRTIDAKSGVAGNQAFHFIGTQGFHSVKGELHAVKINLAGTANDKTIVEGDINGDGRADFQIELTGLVKLTAGDFLL